MKKDTVLGTVLIALGALIVLISLGDLLLKALVAFLGFYLIYQGLKMKNKHRKVMFFVNRYTNRS